MKAADIRLDHRVAIVTGAASGMGRVMAQAMVKAGADVVFADLNAGAAARAVAEVAFKPGHGKGLAVQCDIAKFEDCERIVNETMRLFGNLHILVNNAGKGPTQIEEAPDTTSPNFWQTDARVWREIIDVNVVGTYNMAHRATPHLLANKWGRIVNITTSLPTMQRVRNSPYGVTKAAIETETLIWAQELEGTGVTCNSLIPGGAVDTPFLSPTGKAEAQAGNRELLLPEVIISPMLWLASTLSDGINGRRYVGKFWKPEMEIEEGVRLALEEPVLRRPPPGVR